MTPVFIRFSPPRALQCKLIHNSQKVKVMVVILYICKYNKYVKDYLFADIEKRNQSE